MSINSPAEQPREMSNEAFVENLCESFETSIKENLERIFHESDIRMLQASLDRGEYDLLIDDAFKNYLLFSNGMFQRNQNGDFVNIPECSHKEKMNAAGLNPHEYGKLYILELMQTICSQIVIAKNSPDILKTFQGYFNTIIGKLFHFEELGNLGEFRVITTRIDGLESGVTVFPNGRIESFKTSITKEPIYFSFQ